MNDTRTTNKHSRRGFMKMLASGMFVIGFNPISESWVTAAQAATAADFEILPPLDGTLHVDDATRAEYAQDYGQIIHERPLAVLKPGSAQDISRMVQFARRHGIRIAARGHGKIRCRALIVHSSTLLVEHSSGPALRNPSKGRHHLDDLVCVVQ